MTLARPARQPDQPVVTIIAPIIVPPPVDAPNPPLDPAPADAALVHSIGQGDMDALRILVERHQHTVCRLALRLLRDEHAADDIAQDVFLRVHGAAPRFKPSARVTTWLYQITLNLCRDRFRRAKRHPLSLDAAEFDPAAPPSPDRLDDEEKTQRVRAAVDALPDRQRTAVVLHRYEGLTHARIADVTGWSRSAVESLLVRAYASLRRSLTDLI